MTNLTIIVLTKNNSDDLFKTLHSIEDNCSKLSILIFDGSDYPLEDSLSKEFPLTIRRNSLSYFFRPDIKGIYPSMNFAMSLVDSYALMFLNSGDTLCSAPDRCLSRLLSNKLNGVFASANVLHSRDFMYQYPFVGIKNVNLWLGLFNQLPCHQAIIFNTNWALQHLYPVSQGISADCSVKRQLISSGSFAFLPYCLVNFYFGGQSTTSFSQYKSQDRTISVGKVIRLRIKFFVQYLSFGIPLVPLFKNRLINAICRFI